MAAGRCSICAKNYPSHVMECPRCGSKTAYMSNAEIDADWETVGQLEAGATDSDRKVYDWRLLRILQAGAGRKHAEILAASKADLHEVCDALQAGCTPLRAVAIFGD